MIFRNVPPCFCQSWSCLVRSVNEEKNEAYVVWREAGEGDFGFRSDLPGRPVQADGLVLALRGDGVEVEWGGNCAGGGEGRGGHCGPPISGIVGSTRT